MKNTKLPIDLLLSLIGVSISSKPPKTAFGRVFRWIKKGIEVKDDLNINIKK